MGLLYLAAVSADQSEQEHRQETVDTDPCLEATGALSATVVHLGIWLPDHSLKRLVSYVVVVSPPMAGRLLEWAQCFLARTSGCGVSGGLWSPNQPIGKRLIRRWRDQCPPPRHR
jgi:hypothetical protein